MFILLRTKEQGPPSGMCDQLGLIDACVSDAGSVEYSKVNFLGGGGVANIWDLVKRWRRATANELDELSCLDLLVVSFRSILRMLLSVRGEPIILA